MMKTTKLVIQKNKVENIEEQIMGKTLEEVIEILGRKPEYRDHEQAVFVLKRYWFGLVRKKMFVYFLDGIIIDYFIGIL